MKGIKNFFWIYLPSNRSIYMLGWLSFEMAILSPKKKLFQMKGFFSLSFLFIGNSILFSFLLLLQILSRETFFLSFNSSSFLVINLSYIHHFFLLELFHFHSKFLFIYYKWWLPSVMLGWFPIRIQLHSMITVDDGHSIFFLEVFCFSCICLFVETLCVCLDIWMTNFYIGPINIACQYLFVGLL